MAAGLVSHNITTASGVTFAVISWVPDTGAPDVGAVPVARITDGTSVAPVSATQGLGVNVIAGGIADGGNVVLGATADAASVSTTIKAALRGIATALGITAFDLGSGTGGSRTLRTFPDTAAVHKTGKTHVLKTITLTAHTSAIANGDIIADTQQLDAAFRIADGTGTIKSITVFDPDDQTPYSFFIFLHRTTTSMGTENDPISITDANAAAGIIMAVAFTAGDCVDLINGRMYQRENLSIPIQAVSGTDDLYVSMVCIIGTPTHAGGAIPVVLGIEQD